MFIKLNKPDRATPSRFLSPLVHGFYAIYAGQPAVFTRFARFARGGPVERALPDLLACVFWCVWKTAPFAHRGACAPAYTLWTTKRRREDRRYFHIETRRYFHEWNTVWNPSGDEAQAGEGRRFLTADEALSNTWTARAAWAARKCRRQKLIAVRWRKMVRVRVMQPKERSKSRRRAYFRT
jgi:hypothetical protein